MKKFISFEGHSFNKAEVLKRYKTEAEFLKAAEEPAHKKAWFPGDEDRTEKLKEVYKLISNPSDVVVAEDEVKTDLSARDKIKDKDKSQKNNPGPQ